MLNISKNSVNDKVQLSDFSSYKLLKKSRIKNLPAILLFSLFVFILICLFLPWTQNIKAKGFVTTRSPEQRPQAIQSVIAGRLENWFVQEGDYVNKGDTIIFISEVKSEYFDPELLTRTEEQLDAKSQSITSYNQKVTALNNQVNAINETFKLKQEQLRNKILQSKNKIQIDSIDLVAYEANLVIAENQFNRIKELHEQGLKTLSELQEKEFKVQSSDAKVNVQKNKLLNQRNELTNLQIELLNLENQFSDKLAKAESDRQSALAARLESVAATSKLKNQLSNYSERQKLYYITAPQSGYINKSIQKGIGETIKEGEDIATIMPSKYELAVETYVKPQDLPLLQMSDVVRLRFDGWPAIVISGWPESSTGVFPGKIVAMDQFINDKGLYRILVSPITEEKPWPEQLRVGTGANAFILLDEVPIWYELWRQLNGFPANYYKDKEKEEEVKKKAPIKSVK